MRKVILALLLVVAVGLGACSGVREIVRNGEVGNVEVLKDFMNGIAYNNPNEPHYYSTDTNWLGNDGKLKETVMELAEADDEDYQSADETAGRPFRVFQVEINDSGQVARVNWEAYITAEPKLRLMGENFPPKANTEAADKNKKNSGRTIAGQNNQVKRYIISAVLMDENFDDYSNVDERYAQNTRYVITWDRDAFPNVDEVRQFDFLNQDQTASESVQVAPGDNSVVLDSRKGLYFQLFFQGSPAMEINNWKREDLELRGLGLVRLNGEFYLKLERVPKPKLKTLNSMLHESQGDNWQPCESGLCNLRPMRYAILSNYAKTGYIRLQTKDLISSDCRLINMRYFRAIEWYINDGALGSNPATGKVMGSFVTSPGKLRELSPDLYEQHKHNIHFPRSAKAVKKPLNQPPPYPPGKQAPIKELEEKGNPT
jgi:hypothetical protein